MDIVRKLARKNRGITVIPAPIQFENKAGSANADLLVIDMKDKRAVGVQTKTTVREHVVRKYDPERVVLVDGTIDLANVRVVRTQRRSSKEEVKPWPGIIAASRVNAIQMHGKHTKTIPPVARRENLLFMKRLALETVGSLAVESSNFSGVIEERILKHL